MRDLRINERIARSEVRVIGDDNAQLGVMPPSEALRLARERGLDLVEVAPQSSPPVCRILDFKKFKYEEQRREREAKKKHHVMRLKEVKFKPRIEEHDYQVKLGMLKRFLTRGDQAKVTMVYRGRELAHTELGVRILDRIIEDLKSISRIERNPLREGRFVTMVLGADRDKIRRATKQAAQQQKAAASGAATSGEAAQPAGRVTSKRSSRGKAA